MIVRDGVGVPPQSDGKPQEDRGTPQATDREPHHNKIQHTLQQGKSNQPCIFLGVLEPRENRSRLGDAGIDRRHGVRWGVDFLVVVGEVRMNRRSGLHIICVVGWEIFPTAIRPRSSERAATKVRLLSDRCDNYSPF